MLRKEIVISLQEEEFVEHKFHRHSLQSPLARLLVCRPNFSLSFIKSEKGKKKLRKDRDSGTAHSVPAWTSNERENLGKVFINDQEMRIPHTVNEIRPL